MNVLFFMPACCLIVTTDRPVSRSNPVQFLTITNDRLMHVKKYKEDSMRKRRMCVLHAAAAVSAINPMMAPGGSHSQGPPECRVNAYALCPITVILVSQSSACQKHAKIQSYFSRGNIQRISLSFFMPHSSSSSILMTIIMRNIFSFFLSKTLSREIEKRWRWMMGNNNHNSTRSFVLQAFCYHSFERRPPLIIIIVLALSAHIHQIKRPWVIFKNFNTVFFLTA